MVERMWNYSATGYTIIHECNFCGTFYKETAVYAYHHGEVEFEEIERPVDLDDLYD